MQESRIHRTMLLCFAAILAVSATYGCAKKRTPPEPTEATTTRVNERAVIVHRGDDGSRRYYRDNNGKLYYVDTAGAVHTIDRSPVVQQGPAGLYYIIDDDNVSYSTDDRGRLYYRDNSNRTVYIDDSSAGRVIDPLPIMRGDSYPRIEQVRSLSYCNESWRKCTSRCDDDPGLGSKRNCLENCDFQREQCLQPY